MSVSLRLPTSIRARIRRLAASGNSTPHAFMLEAIRDRVEAEEARAAFLAEAEARLTQLKKSGRGIPADQVFAYLEKRARGRSARRPRERRLK